MDVGYDLDDVTAEVFVVALDGRGERSHGRGHLPLEGVDERVDVGDVDQRLVALDVHDLIEAHAFVRLEDRDGGRDAIGAGTEVAVGPHDLAAELEDMAEDPVVVGGDIDDPGPAGGDGPAIDALDERHAGDGRQRFAGKARRGPARGNYNRGVHGSRFY